MVGYAGSLTYTAYVDMTLTRSKVKVTGVLNFRQLAKPCMLAAMTAAPLQGFLVAISILNPNYDVINDVISGFTKVVVQRCGFHHWIAQRISCGEVVSIFTARAMLALQALY